MYDVSSQRNEWCAYYYCLFQVEALDLFDINLQWHIGHQSVVDWNLKIIISKKIIEELEKKAAISDKNKKEQQGAAACRQLKEQQLGHAKDQIDDFLSKLFTVP